MNGVFAGSPQFADPLHRPVRPGNHPDSETFRVQLQLRTGGGVDGLVVDHDLHGLVVVRDRTPFVFSWSELTAGSACAVRRKTLEFQRGGPNNLRAEDWFDLGVFALQQGCRDRAVVEFRRAAKQDPGLAQRIQQAYEAFPSTSSRVGTAAVGGGPAKSRLGGGVNVDSHDALPIAEPAANARADSAARAAFSFRVMDAYRTFGAEVQRVLGGTVALIETDHFLIWTDWHERERHLLESWCEAMYSALCTQFALGEDEPIFLAKCPVFAWRARPRFQQFARHFDGYAGDEAIGYTRSIEASGHVHVVVLRVGDQPADYDLFASTLVHEGSHAFIHRLYSNRLIPHWVNEGIAEMMAERTLGDRSPSGENAALLARQYVRYDWPLGGLLESTGPIAVEQYALAHSIVAFLERQGPERFAAFVRSLKDGKSVSSALSDRFDGLTIQSLEDRWRASIAHSP